MGTGVLQPVVVIVFGDVLNSGTSNAFFNLPKEQVAEELRSTGYDLEAAIRPTRAELRHQQRVLQFAEGAGR